MKNNPTNQTAAPEAVQGSGEGRRGGKRSAFTVGSLMAIIADMKKRGGFTDNTPVMLSTTINDDPLYGVDSVSHSGERDAPLVLTSLDLYDDNGELAAVQFPEFQQDPREGAQGGNNAA